MINSYKYTFPQQNLIIFSILFDKKFKQKLRFLYRFSKDFIFEQF